jgi:hypothetical protein
VQVFCALSLVLRELRERKEEVKARMYRFLFVTLLLTLLFALTMAFLEVYETFIKNIQNCKCDNIILLYLNINISPQRKEYIESSNLIGDV